MWILGDKQNGSAQGSFPKRMHGRVFFETDARNPNVHFDGCVERTFGQRICARYGANPGCVQPTSRMHATPLIHACMAVVMSLVLILPFCLCIQRLARCTLTAKPQLPNTKCQTPKPNLNYHTPIGKPQSTPKTLGGSPNSRRRERLNSMSSE